MDAFNSMKQIVGSLKKKNGYTSDRFSCSLLSERGVFYARNKVVPCVPIPLLSDNGGGRESERALSHIEMKKVPIIIFCLQRMLNHAIINFLKKSRNKCYRL